MAKKITNKRISLFKLYYRLLENLETSGFIKRPFIPNYTSTNGHIFYIVTKNKVRDNLIKHLKQKKISSVFHYIPLHNSAFGKKKTITRSDMKNTNNLSKNLLRLPLHTKLNKNDVFKICTEIKNFFK